MEHRGIPAATVAVAQLASTVGVAMAAAHGFPNYPIATIQAEQDIAGTVDGSYTDVLGGATGIGKLADRVAGIWLRGPSEEAIVGEGSG